eukprot:6034500-Karenia_brevis.AAC.1
MLLATCCCHSTRCKSWAHQSRGGRLPQTRWCWLGGSLRSLDDLAHDGCSTCSSNLPWAGLCSDRCSTFRLVHCVASDAAVDFLRPF